MSVLSCRRVEEGPAAILNAADVWLMVTLLSARGHADLTKGSRAGQTIIAPSVRKPVGKDESGNAREKSISAGANG